MNSFRTILALFSIMGVVSAAPQAETPVGAAFTCVQEFPECGLAIASAPSPYVSCDVAGGLSLQKDAECYKELQAAGLIDTDGACYPCAEFFDPQGSTPPAPPAL